VNRKILSFDSISRQFRFVGYITGIERSGRYENRVLVRKM
jgi:hypothetical protein